MAVTVSPSGWTVKRTASLPSMAALTWLRTIRVTAITAGSKLMGTISASATDQISSNYSSTETDTDGTTLSLVIANAAHGFGQRWNASLGGSPVTLDVGVTYTVAYQRSGTLHRYLLWSSDGTYNWDEVLSVTTSEAPATALSMWQTSEPGHVLDNVKLFTSAALTADELELERVSYYAVRASGVYSACPFKSQYDFTDWSGNGHHWTVADLDWSKYRNAPGPTGIEGEHVLYRQQFDKGDGSIAIPRTSHYGSNIWSQAGNDTLGSNAAETVYREIATAEDLRLSVGTGPEGNTQLRHNSNPVNGAFVVTDMGPLTSPYPSNGWWDASKGKYTSEIQLTTAVWDATPYALLLQLLVADALYGAVINVALGLSTGQLFLTYQSHSGGNVNVTAAEVITRAESENAVLDVTIRWVCGTVTGPFTSVASDGYITVKIRNRTTGRTFYAFQATGIDLVVNYGRDAKPTGSTVGTTRPESGGARDLQNWARAFAVGYYGLVPTSAIQLEDFDDPEVVTLPDVTDDGTQADDDLPDADGESVYSPPNGADVGLHWVHLFDKGGTEHLWSKYNLADPLTYYGGFKENRVTQWGRVQRAISDRNGQYEGSTFTWTQGDVDNKMQALLASPVTKFLRGCYFIFRSITDQGRRLFEVPRTLMRGIVATYRPLSPKAFEFTGTDHFAALFTQGNEEQQIPKQKIKDLFPGAPVAVLDLPIPVIYGELSDSNMRLVTLPDTPNDAIVSSNPSLTAVVIGGAGSTDYLYTLTAKRRILTNPAYTDHRNETVLGQILVPNGPDAVDYRLRTVLGGPVPLPANYIQLTWSADGVPTAGYIFAIYGRTAGQPQQLLSYVPLALVQTWKDPYGAPLSTTIAPVTDTQVVQGTPIPGAEVLRDDGLGLVPTTYVGDVTLFGVTFSRFLICGHACLQIVSWYVNGVRQPDSTADFPAGIPDGTFLVPGRTGYGDWVGGLVGSTPKYETDSGRVTSCIYVNANSAIARDAIAGVAPITVNVKGVTDDWQGNGALIRDLGRQYRHALRNFLVGDWRTGPWLDTPAFPDDPALLKFDDYSFYQVYLDALDRIPDVGYEGAFMLGGGTEGQVSLREQVARFNVSLDAYSGFDRYTRLFVKLQLSRLNSLAGLVEFTEGLDIVDGTFTIEDLAETEHFNRVPFAYAKGYHNLHDTPEWVEDEVKDDLSIASYGEQRSSARVQLHMVRPLAQAQDVARRRLARSTDPPRRVTFETHHVGLNVELGDIVLVTHRDGIGLHGYVKQPVQVIRHEYDPETFRVRIEGYDVGYLTTAGGMLGDRDTVSTDWLAATPEERAAYTYLADRDTGAFSDGSPGNRLV